ncbi:hypothetical protein [Thalassotalea sp. ND16A]|uniref:hypothetical protein n=1 Tax=Thalassotalea sp. ND16A TaxID=1535422 RepID=UPI00126A421F|nr:hypothetical protein [Thalassotalea sp. ND16A]
MLIKINLIEPDETDIVEELKKEFDQKSASKAVLHAAKDYQNQKKQHDYWHKAWRRKCEQLDELKKALEMKSEANNIINEFLKNH